MEKKSTSGLAVAALVTGIIALFSSFVPLLNLLSFPFVLLAVIFGAIGVWQTVKGSKGGKGLAIAGLVLGIAALLVTAVMYGGAASQDDSPEAAPSAPSEQPAASAGDGDAGAVQADPAQQEAAAYAVTIDGCRATEDYEGKPAAVVTYTFTNNSDEAASPATAILPKVFQNGAELEMAIVTDSEESGKYMNEVKPGSSISFELSYELEDTSDVTVEVTELFSFDNTVIAEQTFSLA